MLIIFIVEAKESIINKGIGQCMTELVAAQIYNSTIDKWIYEVVTNEVEWKFIRLKNSTVELNSNLEFTYPLPRIVAILKWIINSNHDF